MMLQIVLIFFIFAFVKSDDVVHGKFDATAHEDELNNTVTETGWKTNGDLDPDHVVPKEFEPGYEKEERARENGDTTSTVLPETTTIASTQESTSSSQSVVETTMAIELNTNKKEDSKELGHEKNEPTTMMTTTVPTTAVPKTTTEAATAKLTSSTTESSLLSTIVNFFPSTPAPHHLSTTKRPCCGQNCTGPCGSHPVCAPHCSKYNIQNNNYQGEFKMVLHIHDNEKNGSPCDEDSDSF